MPGERWLRCRYFLPTLLHSSLWFAEGYRRISNILVYQRDRLSILNFWGREDLWFRRTLVSLLQMYLHFGSPPLLIVVHVKPWALFIIHGPLLDVLIGDNGRADQFVPVPDGFCHFDRFLLDLLLAR